MTQLILVRHGETTGESSIRLNGSTDVPLSELGRAQMHAVHIRLAEMRFTRVLSSPLSRATEAAAIIAPHASTIVIPDFREVDFGDWETLTYSEVEARDPERLAKMRAGNVDFTFPGGDSRVDFFERVSNAARHSIEQGHTTLIAAHKGTIKAITATLLPGYDLMLARKDPCELGSIHRFEVINGEWTRTALNETGHLGRLHIGE